MSAMETAELAALTRKPVYAGIPSDVLKGIRTAAKSTGIEFGYLVAQAGIESGFDATAKAATSSARGLYQFIEQTWLSVFKDNGEKYGVGDLADKITRGSDGRMRVTDGAAKRQILALRDDPGLAAALGAEYASDNKDFLQDRLGRDVGSTELYMAHFLGPAGAARFLKTLDRAPHASAAAIFPDAAEANRPVFFGKSGKALSVAEVFSRFQSKLTRAGETAVAALDQQTQASTRMAIRAGERLVDTVASAAGSVGRLFTGPKLSPTTVMTLAELSIPGGKGGIGNETR